MVDTHMPKLLYLPLVEFNAHVQTGRVELFIRPFGFGFLVEEKVLRLTFADRLVQQISAVPVDLTAFVFCGRSGSQSRFGPPCGTVGFSPALSWREN